ncbi:helix-turn-helix domain-containing protein [Amycolatopsis minnesotensis]|uniref:NB-ARC domain-containing protein n=1 Tax=Amycolatopsis minnesotensis TaxID=337894 RepID=A0ABP5CBC3_9PSEU
MAERGGSSVFGRELAALLERRGLSWRRFSTIVGCTPGWLSKIKNGAVPSAAFARRCDEVLDAGGKLVALAEAGAEAVVPVAQLPAVTGFFAGRVRELAALGELLGADQPPGQARVVVVDGSPGVGKTALVLRWAHDAAAGYPDGQLFVNLAGYAAGGRPLPAEEALERVLRALGTPAKSVPQSIEERAALYRSLLAGRRMLIVVDNVADGAEVDPLIPGSSACTVLVTSRTHLPGLGVRVGARHLTVGPMSEDESVSLLETVLGTRHPDCPEHVLRELARRCAHLPLALRIAAEQAVAGRHASPDDLLEHLVTDGLDVLALDEVTAIRSVFSWSYRSLPPRVAAMFRVLSVHPGTDFSVPAAAALADVAPAEAARLLAELTRAHLVEQRGHTRFQMHDLLRLYAIELAGAEDPPAERDRAARALVDWYVRSARAAAERIAPYRVRSSALRLPGAGGHALVRGRLVGGAVERSRDPQRRGRRPSGRGARAAPAGVAAAAGDDRLLLARQAVVGVAAPQRNRTRCRAGER